MCVVKFNDTPETQRTIVDDPYKRRAIESFIFLRKLKTNKGHSMRLNQPDEMFINFLKSQRKDFFFFFS